MRSVDEGDRSCRTLAIRPQDRDSSAAATDHDARHAVRGPGQAVRGPGQAARSRSQAGFTLVEIMVVIAILAVMARIATANLGALIPSTVLDSEAKQLISTIEYLRSEAQLQGKTYKVEFDLDRSRWRIVLPPEDIFVSTQTVGDSIQTDWRYMDKRVRFGGFHRMDGHTARGSVSTLIIDENGYTTGTMLYLRNTAESLDDYVWTIHIYGLESRSKLLTNVEGSEPRLDPVNASHFQ